MSDYILTDKGELYHYGVRGMKWGVRRYQNKDGSLTETGKKRLSEESGTYMNPKRGNFKSRTYRKQRANRDAVATEHSKKYWELYDAEGDFKMNYDLDTIKKGARLRNSFIDKYADATLKDFGYESSDSAKAYVKEMFDKDLEYVYDVYSKKTGKYVGETVDSQRGIEERRDYYDHDYKNKRPV